MSVAGTMAFWKRMMMFSSSVFRRSCSSLRSCASSSCRSAASMARWRSRREEAAARAAGPRVLR